MERILRVFHQEIGGLHEAAYLLGGFALLAKLLALVRDRILAGTFGASQSLDIYYAAFRIPDFIYISLGTLVASAVLIPFLVDRLGEGSDAARRFLNNIFTFFSLSILAVSIAVFFLMPYLAKFIVPGLDDSAKDTLVVLARIMLFSPILLGLSGLFASVTQTLRRFFVYALGPVLYNVGIIVGIVVFYPIAGLPGLAYGVVLGAFLHLAIQVPVLLRNRFVPTFVSRINFGEIRNVMMLSLPRTLTLSAHHLVILIFIALASFIGEGSIAVFSLSFNLQSVPLSVIGISYSVAAFPTLARLFSNGERSAFVSKVTTALRHIIFWSFPALVLLIVLRAQVVRVILGTGEFGWPETRLTAAALALFSISIIAQSAMLLLVRGYYAAGRTLPPLIINVASSFFTIVLGMLLLYLFSAFDFFRFFMESLLRVEDIAGTAVIMLPLAFSIGMLLNIAVLWGWFRRDFGISNTVLGTAFRHSFYAAVFMGFTAHQFLRVFDNIFDINTFIGIFSQGLLSGLIGIFAGIVLLRLLHNEELQGVIRTLHSKLWKQKPIAPDQGELQ